MYREFLQKHPDPDFIAIRAFVINYTITWVDERGPGHLRNINGIFKKMFEGTLVNVEAKFKEDIIEYSYTFYFIFEYLTRILQAFTKNGAFDEMEYFTTVFLKNIDVWGFIMIYVPTFEHLYKNETRLTPTEKEIMNTIQSMILLAMESSAEPINIDKVESFLQELNKPIKMAYNLLKGKRGIITGALDKNSIAWKVAEQAHAEGATFVLTNAPIAMRMGEINVLAEQTNSKINISDNSQCKIKLDYFTNIKTDNLYYKNTNFLIKMINI
jgi:hypothetical protein